MDIIQTLSYTTPLYVYASLFVLMIINGTVNFPSSQLLYLFVGYLTTKGPLYSVFLILAGGLGNTLGNILLYETVRVKGSLYIKKIFTVTPGMSSHMQELVTTHGVLYIFLGKLIPGVKIFIPIIAGLTTVKRSYVYIAFLVSSLLWASLFIHIGIFFGTNSSFTKWYTLFALSIVCGVYLYTYKKYPYLFKSSDALESK